MYDLLRGDKVVLRPWRAGDRDDVVAGCNDPVTQQFLPTMPSPYTAEDAQWWIDEGAPSAFANGGGAYAIADPATDRVLGGVSYSSLGAEVAQMGYWVAPWARLGGNATAATRLLATNVFDEGFVRLALRTDVVNFASQRVAIGAGFAREGIARAAGRNRDGSRYDLFIWARLATDPDGPAKRVLPDLPGRGMTASGWSDGELTDGVIRLRPLRSEDTDDTYALRSLPEVVATSVPPHPRSREAVERTCAQAQAGWLAGERADFTIRDAATDAYAGEIGLYYWEPSTQQAMVGYSLAPAWRGRGYATRAATLVSTWAFEHVGVARVVAGTAPENEGSQRVLERAGFVREGYQRARLPGPGESRIDDVLYALVREPATVNSRPG